MKGIEKRKADHIQVTLEEDIAAAHNYWDDIKLIHNSLPEVDLEEIDTSTTLFGRKLKLPFMVTAITGGYSQAEKVNENLAGACAELGIALGVGSQRAGLERGNRKSYTVVKDYDVPLVIGNIGAPQLIPQARKRAYGVEDARKAMDMVDADVLAVHLNFLQEIAQPEGDTRSKGCLEAIRSLSREVPVMVKETGAGISREVALRLKGTGVRGFDVSGTGGTSFAKVEFQRSLKMGDARCAAVGCTFGEWGIPAPISVRMAQVGLPIIASGGILNGLHAAKGMVMGAQCAGMAKVVLQESLESSRAVVERLKVIAEELKAAMFLTGCSNIRELSDQRPVLTGPTREWAIELEVI